MENRSHALAAGLFVILFGVATALAVWFLGGKREFTDTYLLETRKNVTGLNIQAQVRYRGIRAGKVESIEQDADDPRNILVTISLDSRYRLTRSTTARLGYQGVTGLAFVDLEDDGSSREYLAPDGANPPRIALKPTFIDTLGDKAGDIVGQIAELSTRLNRLLDDKNANNLARTLDNVAAASEGLKQLPQVLAAMRAALSDDNVRRLNGILDQVEKTAGEAAPLTAETREMVKAMTAMAQKLDRFVDSSGGEITAQTLPQFNALVKELSANSSQLGRILDTLEERPQALLFGKGARRPGPGEAGFVAPAATEK
ncbi:MAG: MlaD family protein [Rhodocyclaceae bacterium]|nr:MlaD family protein [Rhodocyclaceae bacterium]